MAESPFCFWIQKKNIPGKKKKTTNKHTLTWPLKKKGGLGLFLVAFAFRFREGNVVLPPKPPPAWSRPGI